MIKTSDGAWLAGVDGCRGGWIAAFLHTRQPTLRVRVFSHFSEIVAAPESPKIIAADVPIGLPAQVGHGGRAAENAVRPLLGARQSSVFSVPSRAALGSLDYREACSLALATSVPSRKISKQLFMIAPKIREVDACLRGNADLADRVFEAHTEVAFWRLNGKRSLDEPKKVRGRPHGPGLELRRNLLVEAGFSRVEVEMSPPQGAATDDSLDALACAIVARRIHDGQATSFPDPPPRDDFGLRMAIWA